MVLSLHAHTCVVVCPDYVSRNDNDTFYRYKKEIIRVNKAWERKFGILQASLHALKDESYLRQHLEKQHTTLHQATITYAVGSPSLGCYLIIL